jgi:hypothetical protein
MLRSSGKRIDGRNVVRGFADPTRADFAAYVSSAPLLMPAVEPKHLIGAARTDPMGFYQSPPTRRETLSGDEHEIGVKLPSNAVVGVALSFLIGILFLGLGVSLYHSSAKLTSALSASAVATVTGTAPPLSPTDQTCQPLISYVVGKTTYEARLATGCTARIGSTVTVLYNPAAPGVAMIRPTATGRYAIWASIIFGLTIMIMSVARLF